MYAARPSAAGPVGPAGPERESVDRNKVLYNTIQVRYDPVCESLN